MWHLELTILNDGHVRLDHVTPPERDEATTACVAAVIPLAARFPRFTGMPQTIN